MKFSPELGFSRIFPLWSIREARYWEVEVDFRFPNCFRSVRGRIFSFWEKTEISKGQTLVFLSLSILLSISDGEAVGKKGDGAPVDNWIRNAGRLWTMEARTLFRLFPVTSGGSGKLKLSWSRLLSHSLLISEYQFFGLLVNNSSILFFSTIVPIYEFFF